MISRSRPGAGSSCATAARCRSSRAISTCSSCWSSGVRRRCTAATSSICVWTDVIVSDSALSQAVRTLRRTLGDDSREPRFIRTVARHGYRFVFADVIEEEDDGVWPEPVTVSPPQAVAPRRRPGDAYEPLLDRLTSAGATEDDRREAAELLHALGTSEALNRLGTRPGHASRARCCAMRAGMRPARERCR